MRSFKQKYNIIVIWVPIISVRWVGDGLICKEIISRNPNFREMFLVTWNFYLKLETMGKFRKMEITVKLVTDTGVREENTKSCKQEYACIITSREWGHE